MKPERTFAGELRSASTQLTVLYATTNVPMASHTTTTTMTVFVSIGAVNFRMTHYVKSLASFCDQNVL